MALPPQPVHIPRALLATEDTPSSKKFAESGDFKLQRQFSMEADSLTQAHIGAKMTNWTGVIFMLNSLTGLSLLTLPYAFGKSGVVLGSVLLFACMLMSYITVTFMCEAFTIANALTYEQAEIKVIESMPDLRRALHDEYEKVRQTQSSKSLQESLLHGPPRRKDTMEEFVGEVRRECPQSEFKLRERVELGQMGELAFKPISALKRMVPRVIYLFVVTFTLGTMCALVVTVNDSLAHTVCTVGTTYGHQCDQLFTYRTCIILTFCITLPLCFANLQKTKVFTLGIMIIRFIAIFVMCLISCLKAKDRLTQETFSDIIDSMPTWNPSNFSAVFGNAVFLFGLHHYLPSMVSPLAEQAAAPRVIITAFLIAYGLICFVCVTAQIAWGGEDHEVCAANVGGHTCQVQPLYNLNFAPVTFLRGGVSLFITSYPATAIASIPVAAITNRNTLARWLRIPLSDPDEKLGVVDITMTLLVLLIPSVVAFITRDVQAVIKYVGSYAGLTVTIFFPVVLLKALRTLLWHEDAEAAGSEERPLKSPFAGPLGFIFVAIFWMISLILITYQLFF